MDVQERAAAEQERAAQRSAIEQRDAELRERLKQQRTEAEKKRISLDKEEPSGPLKPLDMFMDVAKMRQESPEKIGQLWTTYHTMRNKLSAVVPATTYQMMMENAKRFPQFVLPLPHAVKNDAGEVEMGYSMQFLQWHLLPLRKGLPSNTPPASTVMFTPLAQYKLHVDYAEPVFALMHYTELMLDKGIVLLRGDVLGADESGNSSHMTQQEAQLLAMCLQRFYHLDWALEGIDNDVSADKRRLLLRAFREKPEEFTVERLLNAALQL